MNRIQNYIENKYIRNLIFGLVTLAVFFPALNSDFIPWDDKDYIVENPYIQSFSFKNVSAIFTQSFIGNYHPVTMISYTFDYFLFGQKASGYHVMNLIFHFLNGCLVFLLLNFFFRENIYSFFGTLIFLVHPVQSESVMWVAERKNLLFVLFYLLALLQYWKFLDTSKLKYYCFALLFFIFSCLSKATAVTFPIAVFLIDYLSEKKLTIRQQIFKVPFFILSLVFGLLAIHFQQKDGFLNSEHDFGLWKNSLLATNAVAIYIMKFFLPINLSTYYPYPQGIGTQQILSLCGVLIMIAIAFYLFRRKISPLIFIGLCFFLINVLPMLQIIPFGQVLVAERYNYFSILGLIIFSVGIFHFIIEKNNKIKKPFLVLIPLLILAFSLTSFNRNKTWKNSVLFYSDILKKFPQSDVILNSLGAEYMILGDYAKAHELFDKSKSLNPKNHSIYYNEGLCFLKENKIENAYESFSQSIEIFPYHKALFARASILEQANQNKRAIDDLDRVIGIKQDFSKAYHLRALCKEKSQRVSEAIADYKKAIELSPNDALYHLNLGIAYDKNLNPTEAMLEFDIAINLKKDYAQAYYTRAIVKYKLRKNPCEDLKSASRLGLKQAEEAALKICH